MQMQMLQPPTDVPKSYLTGSWTSPGIFETSHWENIIEVMRMAEILDEETQSPDSIAWDPPVTDPNRANELWDYVGCLDGGAEQLPESGEQISQFAARLTEPESTYISEYRSARDDISATRSRKLGRVPLFKFTDMTESWTVTPEECDLICQALDRILPALSNKWQSRPFRFSWRHAAGLMAFVMGAILFFVLGTGGGGSWALLALVVTSYVLLVWGNRTGSPQVIEEIVSWKAFNAAAKNVGGYRIVV